MSLLELIQCFSTANVIDTTTVVMCYVIAAFDAIRNLNKQHCF